VLKADFAGKPINEPNMTAWVQGGYEDWRRQQESLEAAGRLVEESAALGVMAQDRGLADRAADLAALALAEQLIATRRMEDGAEKRRAVLKIVRGLVRLRQTDREHERGQREAAQAERRRETHEVWAEAARRRIATDGRRPGSIQDMSDAQIKATLVRLGRRPVGSEDGGPKTEHEHEYEHESRALEDEMGRRPEAERGMEDRALHQPSLSRSLRGRT
jgi:hypothetical protein